MNDQEFADCLTDFCNAVEAAAVQLKRNLYDLVQKQAGKPLWEPDKIKWEKAESSKGVYERATGEANKGNIDFDNLLQDLKLHGGKLSRLGFFYWLFSETETPTVGRKPSKRKETVKNDR